MGTQRVQIKGILPWLVRWACRACIRDVCSALAALVGQVQVAISAHDGWEGCLACERVNTVQGKRRCRLS